MLLLLEARRLTGAEGGHEPSIQVVTESGAVDHLDEEAVRDGVECLQDVHCYGYGSARVLSLVEARDHPSRDGELGRGGGMPRFEAVLGGACTQSLHDGRQEESLQYIHCRAEQWNGAVARSGPGHVALIPSKSGWWRSSSKLPGCRFRQLRGWRAPLVRLSHAHLDGWGGARESPIRPLAVEEPAFLMAAATPLSSNGLYEGSTRWWRWRSLISLLRARSCWAEQAVNYLLKACAIAFELE